MSFPEWGAGGGQWVMVQARELSGISVCVVCGLFLQLLNYQTHGSYCLSPLKIYWVKFFPLSKLSIVSSHFQTVFPLLVSWLALVWIGLVWGAFRSIHSLLLMWPPVDTERWFSFIQFVYKFDRSCVKSMRWDCLSGAQAETVTLL